VKCQLIGDPPGVNRRASLARGPGRIDSGELPRLSARQQAALRLRRATGREGMTSDDQKTQLDYRL